jgi:anti-sigma regulatory factor (Ser/Thr protein kinase)
MALSTSISPSQMERAELLTSELVSNSVRHAQRPQGDIGICVEHFDDRVRVQVSDRGPGFELDRLSPPIDGTSGWGLQIVEQLAIRWGLLRDPTRVWFELAV